MFQGRLATIAILTLLGGALASFPSFATDSPDRHLVEDSNPKEGRSNGVIAQNSPKFSSQVATRQSSKPAGQSVRTRYASFLRTDFNQLPGWREDDLKESWKAFRATCKVLATRGAWSGTCSRASSIPVRNDAIRNFIESEFLPYQILNGDETQSGVITGYFEPLLDGSLEYGGRYTHPVYGVPTDLLYLDARSIPYQRGSIPVYATVQGRAVVPVTGAGTDAPAGKGFYVLDLGDSRPDIRDKRVRVRVEGSRIVPYFTRAEIERGALSTARAIAFVDSARELYSMQIQGSGKVRLPDGRLIRVAYAEQNGHPFLPPIAPLMRGGGSVSHLIRGMSIDLGAVDDASAEGQGAGDAESSAPATRGVRRLSRSGRDPKAASGLGDGASPEEVSRMIDLLLKGPPASPSGGAGASNGGNAYKAPAAKPFSLRNADPSYVFFREIPDSEEGPIGALGVPLTAGRSVAVDPRTTPLGFPVYIATESSRGGAGVRRLMLAQDTGGAIRGPVRADYFWGFGAAAGQRASRMKENGRMWLLVPKDQPLNTTSGLRGTQGREAECLVPDPDLCVE